MRHRMLYLILSACFLLNCISGCVPNSVQGDPSVTTNPVKDTTSPSEETTEPVVIPTEPEEPPFGTSSSLKVLAIGNSFSVDSMEHLYKMIASAGYETVVLGNLHAPSCSLQTHLYYMNNNRQGYTLAMNTYGVWFSSASDALSAVTAEDWDVIVLQQVSGKSGIPESYSDLADVLAWLEANKPSSETKILWNMTWAYQGDSTHGDFAKYDNNQQTMYDAIVNTVQQEVLTKSAFSGVIPTGAAIQNLRSSSVGDTVTRDGYHLGLGIGRYTAALTWYCYLTGKTADSVTWLPDDYAAEISPYVSEICTAVENAILIELEPSFPPVSDNSGDNNDP